MQGISSIIATLLMLIITIGLAALAYSYIMGIWGSRVSQTFQVLSVYNDTVTIMNSGSGAITQLTGTISSGSPVKAELQVTPIDDSLVACYHFDEGNGNTAHDSSGHGNDGTLINGPQWVDGKFGKGVSLPDISNGCIRVSNFPQLLKDKTITTWIFPTAWNRGTIAATTDTGWGKNGYAFATETNGRLFFKIGDGSSAEAKYSRTNFVKLNTWNFIAAVYDANAHTVTFYANGARDGPYQFTSILAHVSGPNLLTLGEDCSGNEHGFPGILDELCVYNRTLGEAEIKANAKSNVGVAIMPGQTARVKVLNIPSKGMHTLRLCTPNQCQTVYLIIT